MGHKKKDRRPIMTWGFLDHYAFSVNNWESQGCASRLKRESEVSNRDIAGLTGEEGPYTSEARSWSNTPLFRAGRRVGWVGECGELPVTGKLTSGGNVTRETSWTHPSPPLWLRIITSWWDLGQLPGRSVVWVGVGKAGTVRQGMYSEQESNHLNWPDHTVSYNSTLTLSA